MCYETYTVIKDRSPQRHPSTSPNACSEGVLLNDYTRSLGEPLRQ
jgi:hypothetical protein